MPLTIDDAPNLVFAPQMSSPEKVASIILDSAYDGRVERVIPCGWRLLTLVGYGAPYLLRLIRPLLEARGQLAKTRYQHRLRGS